MKALSITGVEKIEFVDIDKPKISDNEVLVKVAYCGICGSDIPRYFEGGVHSFPQIVGHEFSGIIEEIGANVDNVKVGDRVVVAPLVPKTDPQTWAGGNPSMATEYSFIGSRQPGAMAEFVAAPCVNIVKIPDNLSLKEAAVVEPLTVAIHGIDRLPMEKSGERVIVYGAGTIGLLTIAALKTRGAGEIICIELNQEKEDIAREMGADIFLNPGEVDVNSWIDKNGGADLVVETAGASITQKQCLEVANKRGKIIYLGTMERDVNFKAKEYEQILRKELLITGSWQSFSMPFPGYEWTAAIKYLSSGQINVKPLITSLYKLEDAKIPFLKLREKNSKEIKVMFEINGEA